MGAEAHLFVLLCLAFLAFWLFKQLPGFKQPVQPLVILLLLALVLLLLSFVWVAPPRALFGG